MLVLNALLSKLRHKKKMTHNFKRTVSEEARKG